MRKQLCFVFFVVLLSRCVVASAEEGVICPEGPNKHACCVIHETDTYNQCIAYWQIAAPGLCMDEVVNQCE